MYKKIFLKKGKESSLKRFHPWVFSGAVARMDDSLEEGDVVEVVAADGETLGVGHYQIGSIAVRMLSFANRKIDSQFWADRIANALQLRLDIGVANNAQNNTFRLVHGEGDNLPGLVIDCYGDTAVMQAHSVGMHMARHEIAQALSM